MGQSFENLKPKSRERKTGQHESELVSMLAERARVGALASAELYARRNPEKVRELDIITSVIPKEAIIAKIHDVFGEAAEGLEIKVIYDDFENEQAVMGYNGETGLFTMSHTGIKNLLLEKFNIKLDVINTTADLDITARAALTQGFAHECVHACGIHFRHVGAHHENDGKVHTLDHAHIGYRVQVGHSVYQTSSHEKPVRLDVERPEDINQGLLFNEGVTELLSWYTVMQTETDADLHAELAFQCKVFAYYISSYSRMAQLIFGIIAKDATPKQAFERFELLKNGYGEDIVLSDTTTSKTLTTLFGPWTINLLLKVRTLEDAEALAKQLGIDLDETGDKLYNFLVLKSQH